MLDEDFGMVSKILTHATVFSHFTNCLEEKDDQHTKDKIEVYL